MQVLFVEDDAMNRRVVKDMLTIVGAEMAEADCAETGLKMIEGGNYDIILMDLRMPGIDGLAAIRNIRSRNDRKSSLPVIVVTADMAANLREKCLSAGADEVISKPVVMNTLFDVISNLISQSNDMTFN